MQGRHLSDFSGPLSDSLNALQLTLFSSGLAPKKTLFWSGEIEGWTYIIMDKLEGTPLEKLWDTMSHKNKLIIMRELGALIREVHNLPTVGLEEIDSHWEQFIAQQINQCVEHHRKNNLSNELLEEIPTYIDSGSLMKIDKPVLLTGEYTPMNFLVKQIDGIWHIDGLIDFGDCMLGLPEYDLLSPGAFLIQGDKALLKEFLTAYGYKANEQTSALSHRLMALMLLHKYSNLNSQVRIPDWKRKAHNMKDLENLMWGFDAQGTD